MNLKSLFEMQKVLDAKIEQEHPLQEGENRLSKKLLALLVEVGELANELPPVFKFWSNKNNDYKKALVEYVDCLHFFLSIGLEVKITPMRLNMFPKNDLICYQFIEVFASIGDMSRCLTPHNYCQAFEKFIGLGEMLGFTWEQIEHSYLAKNRINHERQQNGY